MPGRQTGSGGHHPEVGGQASRGDPRLAPTTPTGLEPGQVAGQSLSQANSVVTAAFTVREGQRTRAGPNGVPGNKSSYSAHVLLSPKLYLWVLFWRYLCNRQKQTLETARHRTYKEKAGSWAVTRRPAEDGITFQLPTGKSGSLLRSEGGPCPAISPHPQAPVSP